jgi:hypothetical protein
VASRGLSFRVPATARSLRHTALLQAPVSFDADVTALEFEIALLDRDNATSHGNLAGDLVRQIRAMVASWNATERPQHRLLHRRWD